MTDETPKAEEVIALLARLEAGQLRPEDQARVRRMLRLRLKLLSLLEQKNAKIAQLQRMLFGPWTEQRGAVSATLFVTTESTAAA